MRLDVTAETVEQSQSRKHTLKRSKLWRVLPVILGIGWLGIAFYPLLYMFITSLRSPEGFFSESPWSPPIHPTLSNYQDVWNNGFALSLANSVVVTIGSVFLIVLTSLLAAYAIVKIRGRFIHIVFTLFLLGLAIPLQATIIPIYVLMINLKIYDTLLALILPSVAFGIPLSVLILVTFIRDIPRELHESMLLDGANHMQILRKLIIPLARPALITVIIYESVQVWNGFLFPLVLTQSPNVRVLPLALWNFQSEFTINVPAIMAAVFLSASPIILLYIFGRRYLLGGLIAGFSK